MENKLYRIKHIPSNLYYKPRGGYSHLGIRGKIYTTSANGISECKENVNICLRKASQAYKKLISLKYTSYHGDSYDAWFKIPKDEFIEEPIV